MKGPIYVDWAITSHCNLNCRHCVGMEGGELSHTQAVKVARDIIELTPRWVILEGGEPLLRGDLPEIGTMLHEAGIDVFIITNGNAFNEDRLKRLASFSPRILFSIDGASADVYEYTKRGASFAVVKEWMARCAEMGMFRGLTTVLSRLNLPQVKDLIHLTESLGGESIIFLPLKPFGTDEISVNYYQQYALTPSEQAAAAREIYGCGSRLDIFYDEPFLWNLSARCSFAISKTENGITIPEVTGCAANHSLYIQTSGSVRPCMFCAEELTFGNAVKESLGDIWRTMQSSDVLTSWANQKVRKGACGECPQFDSCRGCLARTARLLGDTLQSDPNCPMAVKLPA